MQLRVRIHQVKDLLYEDTQLGQAARFSLFICLNFVGMHCWVLIENSFFINHLFHPLFKYLSLIITNSCCFILHPTYNDINVSKDSTIFIMGKAQIQLLPGCTGLSHIVRLTFVLLLYPIHWQTKIYLWPISLLMMVFASTLRFLILIPIAFQYQDWYKLTHDWLAKVIFFGFYFVCWIIWEKARNKWHEPRGKPRPQISQQVAENLPGTIK